MDMDFAVSCPLVRPALPRIRFLFVRSRFCSTLPSDSSSRFCPCASLVLHLHQVAQGTFTPKLPDMSDTQDDAQRHRREPARSVLDSGEHGAMLMVSGAMLAWIDLKTSRFESRPILEAPTVVPSLDDVAVVGQAIQQRAGHLGVDKDAWPFAEGEIGRHNDGGALIELADQIEQQLPAGLGEGEIAEFIEHDEVFADEIFRDPSLPSAARFGLEPIDEIDGVVEAATFAGANAITGDGDGQMCLSGAGSADQDAVALFDEKVALGEIAHEALVDRRAGELEVVEIFGQEKLGDRDLVFDRARLLFADFGLQKIADDARRLMLSLDTGRHDLIIGGLHSIELEFAHQFEDLGSLHQPVLLS